MRLSAVSETTNVAASTPKVTGSPTVAMSTPATGGPSTWPRLPRSPSSADAAVSRSLGTMRGTSASSDGRCSESVAAAAATATNSTHSCGCGSAALTRSRAVMVHCAASVSRTMRRRSTASASAPPTNDMTRIGTSSVRLTRPDHQRRVAQRVRLERHRDVGDHGAGERHRLADEQQPEVAEVAQRRDVDGDRADGAPHGARPDCRLGEVGGSTTGSGVARVGWLRPRRWRHRGSRRAAR